MKLKQTQPHHTNLEQTKPNLTKPNQIRPNQIKLNFTKPSTVLKKATGKVFKQSQCEEVQWTYPTR